MTFPLPRLRCSLFISFLVANLSGCAPKSIPTWPGKIYAGDSQLQSVDRKQDGEIIPTNSKKFDDMLCMTYEDFNSFFKIYVASPPASVP